MRGIKIGVNFFGSVLMVGLMMLVTIGYCQIKTSEDFTVDIGRPYPVIDAYAKDYFFHEGKILAIKNDGNITYQLMNANSLDFLSVVELSKKKELPRGFVHEEFVQQGARIFEFYNVWDKPNKTEQIYVQEINFKNPKPTNSRLLFKINGKLASQMGRNKVDIYESFNEGNYLLIYRKKPLEKKDKKSFDEIGMIVFDSEMNEVWKREVKMPYTEANMDNLGYTIDSKGRVYLLARVKNEEIPRLELHRFYDSSAPEVIEIEAEGKYFPHGISLQEGKGGKIYCAGFYGEGSSANGIYVSVLGEAGLEKEQFHDIPLEIINQNKNERSQKKNERKEDKGKEVGIHELDLDRLIINEDGSLIVLGEVYYVTQSTSYNASTKSTTTTYHYHYKEMFMSKISASGEMLWMNKMVKNQIRSSGSSGMFGFSLSSASRSNYDLSYKYLSTQEDHYLLYLDNLKNLDIAYNEYPAQHRSGAGGFFTAYKINDSTGEVSKLSLFDMRDVNGIPVYQFSTDRIVQSSSDEMILELYKKKKEDVLIRVNIKE